MGGSQLTLIKVSAPTSFCKEEIMRTFTICSLVLCVAVLASSMDIGDRAKGKGKKPKPGGKPTKPTGPKPTAPVGSGKGPTGGKGGNGGSGEGSDWTMVWDMLAELGAVSEQLTKELMVMLAEIESNDGGAPMGSGPGEPPMGSGSGEPPMGSGSGEPPMGSGSGEPPMGSG